MALFGHSRGGEAVVVAALFNRLEAYPDDANVRFDYGFGIRGVVAIAPVDGQYQPRRQRTVLNDTNYFTIHGSLDGDVTSFDGLGFYGRARFTPGAEWSFKSSLYVAGANHGQFNTGWGRCDTLPLFCWAYDLESIQDGEEQRQIAKVYLHAFARIVLHGERDYLPLFADPSRGAEWLPEAFLVANYQDADERILLSAEEDVDPLTAPFGRVEVENLSRFDERWIERKSGSLESHAVRLAWDDRVHDDPASYRYLFDEPIAAERIVLRLAQAGTSSLPPDWEGDEEGDGEGDADDGEDGEAEDEADDGDEEEEQPLDLRVCLTDTLAQRACSAISTIEALYPQIESNTRRRSFLQSGDRSEVILRRYDFALGDFQGIEASQLVRLELIFDLSPRGSIVLDDVGIVPPASAPPPE